MYSVNPYVVCRSIYFAWCIRKLALYSDVIYTLIRLEISHRTRLWFLKCVIVYLARDIPAFVMYCVNGTSRSSLLIESTDSMIYICILLVAFASQSAQPKAYKLHSNLTLISPTIFINNLKSQSKKLIYISPTILLIIFTNNFIDNFNFKLYYCEGSELF